MNHHFGPSIGFLFTFSARSQCANAKRKQLIAALISLSLCLTGCISRTSNGRGADYDARLPRLQTSLPKQTALDIVSELTATIEAHEKTDLCAQVRGVVQAIPPEIDIGRVIKKDDPLITLDIPDLVADRDHKVALKEQAEKAREQAEHNRTVAQKEVIEAQAQVQRYQADLQFRELAHKRLVELSKRETVQPQLTEESRMQFDAAGSALTAAQAQIETKKARLSAAEGEIEVAKAKVKAAHADVARASALVDFATIKAPFDGVITKRWVDSGATVKDPGVPLLTVMRTGVVRVILDVPERDVPYLHADPDGKAAVPSNPLKLRVPALQDAVFDGRITLLAGALDPATRTMRTEVHLDNKAGLLRPQMTGTARLTLARRDKVLTVPSSALVRSGDLTLVYYIADPQGDPPRGVVRQATVELGLDDGVRVEIRAGLTGNEQIVTKGAGVVRVGETAIAAEPRATGMREAGSR
jgi:RND family efflux transporter MFP subunit